MPFFFHPPLGGIPSKKKQQSQELFHIGVTGLRVDAAIYHHVYELAAARVEAELTSVNLLTRDPPGLGNIGFKRPW